MTVNKEKNDFTQPTELRDFFEWHQGIPYYGFWAIEITHPDCLHRIAHCKQLLADKLHPLYSRQAHITLSASGLLSSEHFSNELLLQQIKTLKEAKPISFSLSLTEPNTFTTAAYLAIQDPTNSLTKIRDLLQSISPAEDPDNYIPHATLGFYNHTYRISDLLIQFSQEDFPPLELPVTSIVFARYNTHEIQGRYQVLHRISLHNPT
jgi:2'-5' RNA ligase